MTRSFTLKISEHIDQPDKNRFYNEQLFAEVAPRYDFVTKALSLGRDAAWKRQLVTALPPGVAAPRCVDLACGTGDVTRLLAERYPDGAVTGIDLTKPMLELARQRHLPSNVCLLHADMCDTGIERGTVDIVTGSYALRNAPDLGKALAEVRRIMKPGGIAAFLDFSKPPSRWRQIVEYLLLKCWGGFWGSSSTGIPRCTHTSPRASRFSQIAIVCGRRLPPRDSKLLPNGVSISAFSSCWFFELRRQRLTPNARDDSITMRGTPSAR